MTHLSIHAVGIFLTSAGNFDFHIVQRLQYLWREIFRFMVLDKTGSFRSNTLFFNVTTHDLSHCLRHSRPRRALHCRVLPPGEFNGVLPQPLTVYSGSFITIAITVYTVYLYEKMQPILPRDAMHKRGLCRRAVSVRLSVVFVYCIETSKHIIKLF